MDRRDVLKSASALVATSTVGLAGCSSDDGGDSSNCGTPGDDMKDSFPNRAKYNLNGEITVVEADGKENVELEASAFYTGPEGGEILFAINKYSSESVAADETDDASEQGSGYDGAVGYIQTGAYIFLAIGADENLVTDVMKSSATLSDDCVDDNIEFA